MILMGLLVLFSGKGGIFYRQLRVGRNEEHFNLLKFRTMKPDADKAGKITVGMKDPRITKIGYFLRKTKMDELPQFLNVLKGEMSVIGPRPEVQEYVDHYSEEQREVFKFRPGISDYASLKYFKENELLGNAENPQEVYINEIMPEKLKINLEYVRNWTFGTDLKIIWLTIKRIVFGK
jgi:lipopolysaccharide/colanic/teichoic acid biosynthesis glycosyltransferase